ncbi:MAG: TIGR00366 family protein [Minicystis sp.]
MSGADFQSLPGGAASPGAAPIDEPPAGLLARVAARCTAWAERWIPDAFVFALAAMALVIVAAIANGAKPMDVIQAWGGGFWELLTFTLQMALIIITGYVVATTRPVYRVIAALAGLAKTPRGAVAMVAFFAMVSSWLNWGFSLIFSAMLAKEVARRVRDVDYRAVAASFVPRPRQRVGAGPVRIGRVADGHLHRDAGGDARDRGQQGSGDGEGVDRGWGHPALEYDLPLAERGERDHRGRRRHAGGLPVCAARRAGADGGRSRDRSRTVAARRAGDREEGPDAGRVAGARTWSSTCSSCSWRSFI